MLASNSVDGDAIPLTGDSVLMMENWLVSLFSGFIESNVSDLRVLLATAGAKCGLSSPYLLLAVHYGFLPSLINVLQELGRVCRCPQGTYNLQDRYHL
jgi:hypothetical protein